MIAKISSGRNTARLLGYLYGPGRANEHTDPHLVASWDGFAPDPGRSPGPKAAKQQLVHALDLRVKQAGDRAPEQYVWHCSVRAAPQDRALSDEEWAEVARRVVHATGIAPDGDPDGCRWVAVRHADDHIHIAATTVRGDLRKARHWNDYLTADRELATIEKDYDLFQVVRGDRTAAKRPTRAEQEKAQRAGHELTARERLRSSVRTAVSAATSPEEFVQLLDGTDSILIDVQYFPSGDVRGYKVALTSDTNAAGEPVWFSGSKLAPDLSYPKICERLTNTEPGQPTSPRPDPWHQATAATERIPTILERDDDPASQGHIAALGETLDALPLHAPANIRGQLQQAAATFERATRSRVRAEHHHARVLRSAVKTMIRQPTHGDGSALAMLLDAAILAVIATARWHQLHRHDQQVASAQQTLLHLNAAYDQVAAPPLAALAQRKPPQSAVARYSQCIRRSEPAHADQILQDPESAALATALSDAENAGHNPEELLQQAVDHRALNDARSPTRVLIWRIERLGHRTPPSPQARAALSRSAHAVPASEESRSTSAAAQLREPAPVHAPRRRR